MTARRGTSARTRARHAARTVSRGFGRATARARLRPAYLVVGAQRSGTTSMSRALAQHSRVVPAVFHKGVHYFDMAYDRGLDWYLGHFPTRVGAALKARTRERVITGESSPYYLFHPDVGARIARDLPATKLIVVLRDPVERAYSAYTHERARGWETEPFERALELEQERIAGEYERLVADPGYASLRFQHNAYVTRGQYVEQLERLAGQVGRDKILVVDSQDFFDDPAAVWPQVERFLDLPAAHDIVFERNNARPRSAMDPAVRARLSEHFRPYDERLATWWGPDAELAPVTTILPAGAARAGAPPATGLVRSAAVSLAGAGAAGLLNAVLSVATTRGFTKVEAGELFATTSVFVLLYTITRLGAGTGVVYFLARHRALDEQERIRPTLRAAIVPVLGMSVLVAGVLLLWAPQVAQLSGRPPSGAVDVALRALAVFLPLAALSDLWIASARGFGSLGPLVVIEKVLRPALQVVATLAVAVLGLRPALWLPLAWAAPYALSAGVALVWLRRLVGRSDLTLRRSAGSVHRTRGRVSEMGPFWRFTAPRSVTSIVQVALQRLDVLLVFSIMGPAQAAIYTAATRFLILGQLGSQALAVATQHRFARLLAVNDTAGAKQLYALVTGWLVLLTWPAYLAFAVFGDYVLEIFGRGYKVGWSVMIVLALMMLVATGCGMVENVLNMAGKTVWNLVNNGVALAANVGLNLLLIPRWGLVGAATAWAVSIFLSNAVPLVQLAWKLKLHPFGPSVYVSAALSVATFGVAAPLLRVVAGPIVALVVPTVLLLVGVRVLRRTLAVDAMLSQLLSGRGRRGSHSARVPAATAL